MCPASPEKSDPLGRESLESFLAALPYVWQKGEIRPTHRKRSSKPHNWRTRPDPFAGVWTEVLGWLQAEPDATAKALFYRLQEKYPRRYPPGQLRTLQRRVKDWQTDSEKALNDGIDPADSNDQSIPRFTWWDHKGTGEWVQFDFQDTQVSWSGGWIELNVRFQ